jgi:hypothetical protein
MNKRTLEVKRRQCTESSVEEFKCLLSKESWQEVLKTLEVNATLQVFTNTFCCYFNAPFPHKSVDMSMSYRNKWITLGIKISSKKCVF